jgi:hypothetical protein
MSIEFGRIFVLACILSYPDRSSHWVTGFQVDLPGRSGFDNHDINLIIIILNQQPDEPSINRVRLYTESLNYDKSHL